MAKLTTHAVDEMLAQCIAEDAPEERQIIVEGIINSYAFDREKIEAHRNGIRDMLAELPAEFKKSGGGGWSFLNACMRADGQQWTGLHQQQERLFALGIAAGLASWLMPREMWDVLPGGMPYVQVEA